eukprot:CAMPEP_0179951114 /NCGR_PEP_ID=MMETSP0983-20121128/23409_1 /TAXON_ID=483367 /ORGANISM="non described non described, Strain CCMP 2436" /LENGTH=36 /DNA_ID= /DNA_START= /DNA_END= /DNA_ORIENTATION=
MALASGARRVYVFLFLMAKPSTAAAGGAVISARVAD